MFLQKSPSKKDDVLRKVSNKLDLDIAHVAGINVKQLWFIFTDNSLLRFLEYIEIAKRQKVRNSSSQKLEAASSIVVPKGRTLTDWLSG